MNCVAYQLVIEQAWWYTPVIPALRRLNQEDQEFKAKW
jgi:hypothetical protein